MDLRRIVQQWRIGALVVLLILLLVAPAVLPTYPLSVLTEILIFSLFAMSLNLLLGYAGLPSLGHSAFFGTGGYAVGLLAKYMGIPAPLALLTAVLAGFVLALVTGPLVLRTHGAYFLILTLSLTQVLFGIVWLWRKVTGGDDGLPGIPTPKFPFSLDVPPILPTSTISLYSWLVLPSSRWLGSCALLLVWL